MRSNKLIVRLSNKLIQNGTTFRAIRNFSSGMMRDSTLGAINDDEFLPEFEEKEIAH